jgi:oxygen-independent coproporphyrinogen-3 oxidase
MPSPEAHAASTTLQGRDPGFGIYLHWPFCLSKCPYCDFNSHVRDGVDQDRWCAALLAELRHYAEITQGRRVTSIFFGGGTPSLMPPETVAALLDAAAALWALDPGLEVTLEANPTSVESGAFAQFAAAGVNRVSLGVQALDDDALKFLGRRHSAAEALAAIALARRHFERFSFDLIYARPGQAPEDWAAELRSALAEGATHLSVYQLTIEPNTAFHGAWRRGELTLPDEATQAALFEATQETLAAAGLPAYEISNHAAAGARCRHNLTYWRYGDYLGVGPGAHGRVTLEGRKWATRQHRAPEVWLAHVETAGHATRAMEAVGRSARRDEMTMMGLRLAEGIDREAFSRETGGDLHAAFAPGKLDALFEAGYLELGGAALRATPSGRQRLDAVLAHLLA